MDENAKKSANEMKDLKSELDLLKRRIERQEADYIQTMRLNTMLKTQVLQLQNGDVSGRRKSQEPHHHQVAAADSAIPNDQ